MKLNKLVFIVIFPEEKIEKAFVDEKKFMSYIKSLGIDDPKLQDINLTFDKFVKDGTLEWFPES